MSKKKRKTRAEKIGEGKSTTSTSKYALKVAKRKRLARAMGLPESTPMPLIQARIEMLEELEK